jgi:MinD superfamily P-loop ATPase
MNDWALPSIDYERCTQCGVCVTGCSQEALTMGATGPYFSTPQNCTYCADCEALCPAGAITCSFQISWGE